MIETATYEIKTYSPEFLDEEVKLTQDFQERKKLDEHYLNYQTEAQIDNLKNYRENGAPNFPFIPTDHWYLFDKNDGMVGHIHAFPQQNTKRCSISIAVTKEGHEEGSKLLMETLTKSVKERGYEVLVKNTTEDHNAELEFLNSFGFEQIRIRNIKSRMPISDLEIQKNDMYHLVEYDDDAHRDKIINDLYVPKGYQKEQLENQFDNLKQARENGNVPSWVVAMDGENIVGQSIAFYGRPNVKYLVQFNTVTTNIADEESLPLINAIYGIHLEKLPENITHVEHYLFGQVLNLRPIYEKLGFKYLENHLYEKNI